MLLILIFLVATVSSSMSYPLPYDDMMRCLEMCQDAYETCRHGEKSDTKWVKSKMCVWLRSLCKDKCIY
ncbi:hypothetical protein NP493_915g00092 [Ridgeia piscesae]|uniref:Uncharacterized protein n=1 Tax=Ridgeia piscesae TaxID=27915 RepID=A0AAD9NLQ9_RIDPI|nr:hypothetical protein NP493_915g00092 [Ridgeia piscesae]